MSKIFSPFADGSIVEPKDFVGRRDIIEKFEPYLKDSINGNPNYFLITGEYYIGKSSFLKYLSFYAKEKYKIISCSWLFVLFCLCFLNRLGVKFVNFVIWQPLIFTRHVCEFCTCNSSINVITAL